MSSRCIAWLQALVALTAEELEPDKSQERCEALERIERSRVVRGSRGFRLMSLSCGGKPRAPEAWLLRYAMGRALAAQADPERKAAFTLQAACTRLGERSGTAIAVLAAASGQPLAGGLIAPHDDGFRLALGLDSWLVSGEIRLGYLEPTPPRDWLTQQEPIQRTARRIGGLVDLERFPLMALTSADPLVAAALSEPLSQARGRAVRCWTLDEARRGTLDPFVALHWIGAVGGFDPMVIVLADEERGPWSDNLLSAPQGAPPASADTCLWLAFPEAKPNLPWLRHVPTCIDLGPLRGEIQLPGQPRADADPSSPRRCRYRRTPFGFMRSEEPQRNTELSEADRRLQLEPLQRAVFPDHDPNAASATEPAADGDAEAHLSPALWSPSEQTLDHLVLPDAQHLALSHAAGRVKQGERCVVLLHGPPGSGKSMAGRCLAGSAGLPVYQLEAHLGRDMFFGEQERKLAEIFEALTQRPAVLIIDEVDGWIGRREGSAAQVGGAKITESSTLLLMLERYQGAAVLTTNRIEALDPALQRRVDLDLHLGLPGATERMALWSVALGDELALQPDELCLLAGYALTGGDIAATVREVKLKRGELSAVALMEAARDRARRAGLWG